MKVYAPSFLTSILLALILLNDVINCDDEIDSIAVTDLCGGFGTYAPQIGEAAYVKELVAIQELLAENGLIEKGVSP